MTDETVCHPKKDDDSIGNESRTSNIIDDQKERFDNIKIFI